MPDAAAPGNAELPGPRSRLAAAVRPDRRAAGNTELLDPLSGNSVLLRVAAALLALAGGCGEPPLGLELPARAEQQQVADLADILDTAVEERLAAVLAEEDLDVVGLTYTTPQASCGEAFRAGRALVRAWNADVAVVAVAREGDFASEAEGRERCLGVSPRDEFAVPGSLREEIAEGLLPPIAARNAWSEAFTAAADRLAEALPAQR